MAAGSDFPLFSILSARAVGPATTSVISLFCRNGSFGEVNKLTKTMERGLKKIGVTVSKPVLAIVAIIFGLLVIVLPELLQLIVGLYFIIQGILLLTDYMESRRK